MSNDVFDLPPRDGMADGEYIECLEASIKLLGDLLATMEARLQASDQLLKALVLTSPNARVVITTDTARKAQAVDLGFDFTSEAGSYVLFAKPKETSHVKH